MNNFSNITNQKLKNYLSALFPFILIFLTWPRSYLYSFQMFKLALTSIFLILYIIYRISKNGKFHLPKWWWIVAIVYAYFFLSLAISPNREIGTARLVQLLVFGLIFFFTRDALGSVLNREVVLKSLIFAIGLMMTIAIFEVITEYQDWWEIFGYGAESPPITYRIMITMHANHWLALINLFLPVVVIFLFSSEKLTTKGLAGIWVVLYFFVAYFSSSRGGYVAITAGLGVLLILLLNWRKIFTDFLIIPKIKRVLIILGLITLVFLAGILFYRFLIITSSHPSHGGETGSLNLNRAGIWKAYLNEWLADPILGAGIGRPVFGLFEANRTIPPGWLPIHSHNMPLGILAEFGSVGALLIGTMIVLTMIRIVHIFYGQPREERYQTGGIIAGLSTLLIHSMFEEFLLEPVIMTCAITLIAWLVTQEYRENAQDEQGIITISVIWLGVIALLVGTITFFYLRPFKFLSEAALSPYSMDRIKRAELVDQAITNRPSSHFLISQGALFWMQAWEENQNPDELSRAEELISSALEIEPAESHQWMNLAAINWAQGDVGDAIYAVNRAILLAPQEPVYYLNLGWYYETLGDRSEASKNYHAAMQYSEQLGWVSHPFWYQSEVREMALDDWGFKQIDKASEADLKLFLEAYRAGNIKSAEKAYMRVNWDYSDPKLKLLLGGLLAFEEGDIEKAFNFIRSCYQKSYTPNRLFPLGDWKRFYYRTIGIGQPFIPGVLQLSQDFGQFELYEEIFLPLEPHLSPEQLCELEKEYTLAVSGGQLWQDGVFIPSICDQ